MRKRGRYKGKNYYKDRERERLRRGKAGRESGIQGRFHLMKKDPLPLVVNINLFYVALFICHFVINTLFFRARMRDYSSRCSNITLQKARTGREGRKATKVRRSQRRDKFYPAAETDGHRPADPHVNVYLQSLRESLDGGLGRGCW